MIANLCAAVDNYLLELAEKQELTVDVLCQLVSALPADKRSSHDILYKVVQTMIKSGNDITSISSKHLKKQKPPTWTLCFIINSCVLYLNELIREVIEQGTL